MAYGLYPEQQEGALSGPRPLLSDNNQRKVQAALDRVYEASGGHAYGAPGAVQTAQNPGTEMGPPQSTTGLGFDLAKEGLFGLASGFGAGPLSLATSAGRYALNPGMLTSTSPVSIDGLGTIATSPGPLGPMLDITGFGGIARAAGALNAANLQNIAATDPNATMVSGPGYAGAFSHGTFSGTLPGGLEAATRRAMIKDIAAQHYAGQRDRDAGGRFGGGDRDPREGAKGSARSGGGYRAE